MLGDRRSNSLFAATPSAAPAEDFSAVEEAVEIEW